MKKMMLVSAAALVLPIAQAADPPELKEGLWSIRTQLVDNPGNKKDDTTTTLCRNHAYDKSAITLAKNAVKGCKYDERFEGGKYATEMHCVIAGTVIETKATAAHVGDTSVHGEDHTTYSPPLGGVSESIRIVDQKYIGSCPAGAQPGDLTNAEGNVVHLGKY
ncbi:MAG: DUF3617 family protein [Bryobacteraceae bacterium]